MTHCQECGRPWGVLLDRGEEPSDEKLALARAELIEMLMEEDWSGDYDADELAAVDVTKLPQVYATWVVFITEALARFVDDHGIGETPYEDCWIEEEWADVPGWLLKSRKHRWALRWDCCDIGSPEKYTRELESRIA